MISTSAAADESEIDTKAGQEQKQIDESFVAFVKASVLTSLGLSNDNQKWAADFDQRLNQLCATPLHPPLFVVITQTQPSDFEEISLADRPLQIPCLFIMRSATSTNQTLGNWGRQKPLDLITTGTLSHQTVKSFHSLLQSVYGPQLKRSKESVMTDLKGDLDRFMAIYSDAISTSVSGQPGMTGRTNDVQFYVPLENFQSELTHELVHRLEDLLGYWSKQIKSVLMNVYAKNLDDLGLLDEVKFWSDRLQELSALQRQLDRPQVAQILRLLRGEKSSKSALDQFDKLFAAIKDGLVEAEENTKVLGVLVEPCTRLKTVDLRSMHQIIMRLLVSVRIVSTHCKTYDSADRLASLLRRLGNDIVVRCMACVQLSQILSAQTSICLDTFDDISEVCRAWKTMMSAYQQHCAKVDSKWNIDVTSITSQTDALLQRCEDFKELISAQIQFSRVKDGKKEPLAFVPVSSGLKITKVFEDVDLAFDKELKLLLSNSDVVLNVKRTEWHSLISNFRRSLKEFDLKIQNAINLSFEEAKTIEKKVVVFAIYSRMAYRDAIIRCLDKCSADLGHAILNALSAIKTEYEHYRATPELMRMHPDEAGSAFWSEQLLTRTKHIVAQFQLVETKIPDSVGNQIKQLDESLKSLLESYTAKIYQEWSDTFKEGPLLPRLSRPLMRKGPDGRLRANFPSEIAISIAEASLWNSLKMDSPVPVQDVVSKKDQLRLMTMGTKQICREYNGILDAIPLELKNLFLFKIESLDRQIGPGLSILTWLTKGSIDSFVKECLKQISTLRNVLEKFSAHCKTIQEAVVDLGNVKLCLIENKKIYSAEEFSSFQASYRQFVRDQLTANYRKIQTDLKYIYDIFFPADSSGAASTHVGGIDQKQQQTQANWVKFLELIDANVEDALRSSVKHSLQDISKAINGEGKGKGADTVVEISPIFRIQVVLENQKVEFNPPLQQVEDLVNKLARDMISTIAIVPAFVDEFSTSTYETSAAPTPKGHRSDKIAREEDILKVFSSIQSGMTAGASKCLAYTKTWDGYREIWEINKDAFIRRYAKLKPSVATFDADIGRYSEVSNNAQKEETFSNIAFIRLDCSPLKHNIAKHCSIWQEKLCFLLEVSATENLRALYDETEGRKKLLQAIPIDLESLSTLAKNIGDQKDALPTVKSKFDPIKAEFQVLEKYDVQLKEGDAQLLDGLETQFAIFIECLSTAERVLEEYKSKFKNDLLLSVNEFAGNVSKLQQEIPQKGPLTLEIGSDTSSAAFKSIEKFKEQAQQLGDRERVLLRGLLLFRIDQAPSKDLEGILATLEVLTSIWQLAKEWHQQWETCRVMTLSTVNIEQIADAFALFHRRLQRFGMRDQVKEWEIYKRLTSHTERIQRLSSDILPHLKNQKMKQRHWAEVSTVVGRNCNPFDSDFTIERMLDYGMDAVGEKIKTISDQAFNEM